MRAETFLHWICNLFNSIRCSFLTILETLMRQSDVLLLRYGRKGFLRALKQVLRHSLNFFDHFGGYFASIGRNVPKLQTDWTFLLTLKVVLDHSSLIFELFGGYFASIARTLAKIWARLFLCGLWNWFYGICRPLLSTFVGILRQSDILLPRSGRKHIFVVFWNQF